MLHIILINIYLFGNFSELIANTELCSKKKIYHVFDENVCSPHICVIRSFNLI